MRIIHDEPKRLLNLKTHRLNFDDLDSEFFDRAVILPAKGNRLMAIGRLYDAAITVVFAPLGTEAISVISMRRASRKERKLL